MSVGLLYTTHFFDRITNKNTGVHGITRDFLPISFPITGAIVAGEFLKLFTFSAHSVDSPIYKWLKKLHFDEPLVICKSLLLNMTIEMLDLPKKNGDFPIKHGDL